MKPEGDNGKLSEFVLISRIQMPELFIFQEKLDIWILAKLSQMLSAIDE